MASYGNMNQWRFMNGLALRLLQNHLVGGSLQNSRLCGCHYIMMQRRNKASRTSPFPKEGGEERIMELAKKFNPPPQSKPGDDIPADMGIKIDSTGSIFDSFVPVEKKALIVSPEGMKQRWAHFKAFLISTYSVGSIKRKVKPFQVKDFAKVAQKKYIDVNNALQSETNQAERVLEENVTRIVAKSLKAQFQNPARKVYWRFVKEAERPRVVHARIAPVMDKDNLYAQVTVRICTDQILAVKDRYGRLLKGNAKVPKTVIDYVVFERHIVDPYGTWRICGKLFPEIQQKIQNKTPAITNTASASLQR